MNLETFDEYCQMFVNWVRKQRTERYFTEDEQILLFLDSHTSRGNPISLKRFQNENVTIITFPGQITHVIQPFDVSIAGPWRTCFRRILRKLKLMLKEKKQGENKLSQNEKRHLMIQAAIEASQQTLIYSNCRSAFIYTGLWPRDMEQTFRSPYVINDDAKPLHPNGRYSRRSILAGRIITTDAFIEELEENQKDALATKTKRKTK